MRFFAPRCTQLTQKSISFHKNNYLNKKAIILMDIIGKDIELWKGSKLVGYWTILSHTPTGIRTRVSTELLLINCQFFFGVSQQRISFGNLPFLFQRKGSERVTCLTAALSGLCKHLHFSALERVHLLYASLTHNVWACNIFSYSFPNVMTSINATV